MKENRSLFSGIPGGSSLLVILAALCMTVFSLLAITAVQEEKQLSDLAAESVVRYYRADLEAERILARLRLGQLPEGVREENGIYAYACPVSQNQILLVEVRHQDEAWKVLRWQTVVLPEEIPETISVWPGT